METKLISPATVAKACGVSRRTVIEWARRRRIPFVKVNARVYRFYLPDVIAALKGTNI